MTLHAINSLACEIRIVVVDGFTCKHYDGKTEEHLAEDLVVDGETYGCVKSLCYMENAQKTRRTREELRKQVGFNKLNLIRSGRLRCYKTTMRKMYGDQG